MQERALAIEERAYGRDHPEVAKTLTTSGRSFVVPRLGRPRQEARHAGARARDQGAGVRPRPHESGRHADNLGGAYRVLGDHAKARDMLERALAIKEPGVRPRPPLA